MRRPVVVLALLAVLLAPAIALPRTVEAQEPRVWFEPSSGSCEHEWVLSGIGYPAEALVTIGIPGMTDLETVTETRANEDGSFRAVLPPTFPGECRPGSLVGLAAVTEDDGTRVFRIAAYEVASPYRLRSVACAEDESTFEGTGYPPGLPVTLMWVQDSPFTDHAAIVGTAVTGEDGAFVATYRIGCLPDDSTIVANGARLDSTVPSPAATGHGLARSTERGVPLALAVVALATLGVARLATRGTRGV